MHRENISTDIETWQKYLENCFFCNSKDHWIQYDYLNNYLPAYLFKCKRCLSQISLKVVSFSSPNFLSIKYIYIREVFVCAWSSNDFNLLCIEKSYEDEVNKIFRNFQVVQLLT